MTKQTTEHDETAGHDDPPVIAGCDRQSHKSNRHPNLSASHPDLYSSHTRPDRGASRRLSRAGRENQRGNIRDCGRGAISKIAGQAGMDGRVSMYLRSHLREILFIGIK